MEACYMPDKESFVSEEVDLSDYFQSFTKSLNELSYVDNQSYTKKSLMMKFLKVDEQAYTSLKKTCNIVGFYKANEKNDLTIPIQGFRTGFKDYKIPNNVKTLSSLKALAKRTSKDTLHISKRLRYIGEKDLEDKLIMGKNEHVDRSCYDMESYREYLLTVRVYLPAKHRLFVQDGDRNQRMRPLHVSQEFIIPGGATLDMLRDRIICQGDFQSVEGDVSEYPWTETTVRLMDVFKSGMFYFGNHFYIDKRYSTCQDYCTPILEWGLKRNIKLGGVSKMENTYVCQLKFRMGYPYVYMHLGNCEHLIVFTDARLLHPRDCHVFCSYPAMKSYASLRGKYCRICRKRLAKYIIVDSDRLPFSKVYMCAYCSYLFNYDGYKKIGNFKVYKYVDRVALL